MCFSLTLNHLSGKQFAAFNCRSDVIRKQMSHRGSGGERGGGVEGGGEGLFLFTVPST